MRFDVAGAAPPAVAPREVAQRVGAGPDGPPAPVDRVLGAPVARQQPHQADEVVAVPVAVHVALARAEDAPEHRAAVERGRVDDEADGGVAGAVHRLGPAVDDGDGAAAQAVQGAVQEPPRATHRPPPARAARPDAGGTARP